MLPEALTVRSISWAVEEAVNLGIDARESGEDTPAIGRLGG
jgi:hypothetical protein